MEAMRKYCRGKPEVELMSSGNDFKEREMEKSDESVKTILFYLILGYL